MKKLLISAFTIILSGTATSILAQQNMNDHDMDMDMVRPENCRHFLW